MEEIHSDTSGGFKRTCIKLTCYIKYLNIIAFNILSKMIKKSVPIISTEFIFAHLEVFLLEGPPELNPAFGYTVNKVLMNFPCFKSKASTLCLI